jgi:hydrogenase maturation protease
MADSMPTTCIVGLGSPNGDDQFGWLVVERLVAEISRRRLPAVVTRRASTPVQVLDWLDGIDRLLLIDAFHGQSALGSLVRLEWPAHEIEQISGSGTHDYTIWQMLNLASRVGTLPRHCHLWCAAEQQCEPLQPLSPSLLALVPQVVDDAIGWLTK